MADSLLDNYNPLYDIHLRQYFALPHMQKHLQKMGLLESTLNLNGEEVYARHHAMMDMMLKNREAQLMKMAELRKKLDAAEKVECCRRIRTGQSPESYRQGKPSRSLSRNRAGQSGGGGRQRRYSNSFEDRDFVQRIEDRNTDPVEQNTKDPYKRLSANAKRFNYLHKLDDNTLIAYKDNLKKQLQRLERFREISFGPHSVARQPPPQQASWFFRRRSVLNMRGRKATTGNKLNASHDSRTSCPPTTRKRKDSNGRLPPINPHKNRVPTKPPAPVSLQQITTRLPPAAKKPAPSRGRPSNKRQTTTTTTTTITSVSKSPQISDTNTLPTLPSVTGRGIFTGAAAAATAAAIGTAAINMDTLIDKEPEPSPPRTPVLETQKTFDRTSPTDGVQVPDEVPPEILDKLADESEDVEEKLAEQEEQEFIPRQIVLDNADPSHGDYEDSDSEPEYAEEDREPLAVQVQLEHQVDVSPPTSNVTQDSPKEMSYQHSEPSPALPSPDASVPSEHERFARSPPTLVFTEQSTEDAPESPNEVVHHVQTEAQQSPVIDVHSTHVVEHFDTHDESPQSPVLSVHGGEEGYEDHHDEAPVLSVHTDHKAHSEDVPQSPVQSVHSSHASEHIDEAPQSPVPSVHSSHASEHIEQEALPSPVASERDVPSAESPLVQSENFEHHAEVHSFHASEHIDEALPSPVQSVHSSHDHHDRSSPVASEPAARSPSVQSSRTSEHFEHRGEVPQSPSSNQFHSSEHIEEARQSPVTNQESVHSPHASEHFEHREVVPHSPAASQEEFGRSPSVHSPHVSEHFEHHEEAQHSPVASQEEAARSPSVHSSHASEHFEHHEEAQDSPVASQEKAARSPSVHSSHASEDSEHRQEIQHSPAASQNEAARSPSVHSSHASEHIENHGESLQSPVASMAGSEHHNMAESSEYTTSEKEISPSIFSSHTSEQFEQQSQNSPVASERDNRSPTFESSVTMQAAAPLSPAASDHAEQARESPSFERAPSLHSQLSGNLEHDDENSAVVEAGQEPATQSPIPLEQEGRFERAASVNSYQASESFENQEATVVEHHAGALQSPVASEKEVSEAISQPAAEPAAPSPISSEVEAHSEHHHTQEEIPIVQTSEHIDLTDVPRSPAFSMNDSHHEDQLSHEAAPHSPVAFTEPRVPSVHTSDTEEESFEVQHHAGLTQEYAARKSPTEMDLYNPSRDNQESPVMSETEAIPIVDRIDLEAYHNSPTKESTSPVTVNPVEVRVSADEVAEHLASPHQNFEDEPSHLVDESEVPNNFETVPEQEAYAPSQDAMMTSIYQPGSDTETREWDEGEHHVKESTTHSEHTDGNTHTSVQETITTITDNGHDADNISTDSLVIHEPAADNQMTQSIYQPHSDNDDDDDKVTEKEWDEGNKHVHEITEEHTDESGKHFTETVTTTTTTVIKSGDDMKNNNDEEDGSDEERDKIIEEEGEHGSNGNLVRETITTTTHTVTSGGLPEGGILVDDGDETNISSL
ncbi:Serine-rich adhesin for platelets [Caenorhabditis elegans]|uniref:Serine-rich adhesin for platelets n=2 Tax=Caenorhabditis elegans TaxID=6239 RepID=A0A5E4M3B1_CAEEL|nr:Serine-rich adhesin for platelets [Caenorhabditis elegans]VVC12337.1 Serine-rich adhesin for platelets [Caenorhabditis elegans]